MRVYLAVFESAKSLHHPQRRPPVRRCAFQREFFIENLLVRIHFIIVMSRWTGLAPCAPANCTSRESKASLRRTGIRSTCGPKSPYSGRDCVKSLRSSYTGLYPPSPTPRHKRKFCLQIYLRVRLIIAREQRYTSRPYGGCRHMEPWIRRPHRRNVQLFRGGLVFKAHRLLYHSTLVLIAIKKKK